MELFLVALVGLAFGSFVTLASWRLPRDEGVVRESSRCPSCRKKLAVRDLVPVLSWLWNKGRCRRCKAPVPLRYPLIELTTALAVVGVYLLYGLTFKTLIIGLLAVCLITLIVTDFEHYIIPDEVQWAMFLLALCYHWHAGTSPELPLGGGLLGLAIGMSLHHGYRVWRGREGLGMGDVKMLAVIGVWTGAAAIVPILFLSGVLGIFTAIIWKILGKGALFPFGPSLALSFFLCVLWPQVPEMFWQPGRFLHINTYENSEFM